MPALKGLQQQQTELSESDNSRDTFFIEDFHGNAAF